MYSNLMQMTLLLTKVLAIMANFDLVPKSHAQDVYRRFGDFWALLLSSARRGSAVHEAQYSIVNIHAICPRVSSTTTRVVEHSGVIS